LTDSPIINTQHNKALHPTAYSPFVPHLLSAAGEFGRSAVARGLTEGDTIKSMRADDKEWHKRKKKVQAFIFDAVRGVIHQWDPYGLLARGGPLDEFDSEIHVVRQVDRIGPPQYAVRVLSRLFSSYFEPERFRPKDCQVVGEQLYKVLQERGLLPRSEWATHTQQRQNQSLHPTHYSVRSPPRYSFRGRVNSVVKPPFPAEFQSKDSTHRSTRRSATCAQAKRSLRWQSTLARTVLARRNENCPFLSKCVKQ
jgi:hypothetical protein